MADEFKGKYARLFPNKVSTSSLITALILYILDRQDGEPLYGQEIADRIAAHTEKRDRLTDKIIFEGYQISRGVLYDALSELEEAGMITGEWLNSYGRPTNKKARRYWRILPSGKEHLKFLIESNRHPYEEAMYNLKRIGDVLFK